MKSITETNNCKIKNARERGLKINNGENNKKNQ